MKILLTGTSGFLGAALAKRWAARHEIQCIPGRKNFSTRLAECASVDCFVHCGFEVVFHSDPEAVKRNLASAEAIKNFFAAGKAKRLVFLSAAGVMGVAESPVVLDEFNFGKISPGFEAYRDTAYVQSKIQAEELFRSAGIPLTVLYPTTVFGPGMPRETLAGMVAGKACPPGGTSFLALEDFLCALDLVIEAEPTGERYILNGGNILFSQMFRAAREVSAGQEFFTLPRFSRYFLKAGKVFLRDSFLSLAVLESAFGFKYYTAEKFENRFSWKPRLGCREALRAALGISIVPRY